MDENALVKFFTETMKEDPNLSAAVAAITTLIQVISKDEAKTLAELEKHLKEAIRILKSTNSSVASITSGCDLFLRFLSNMTQAARDTKDFQECKDLLITRGNMFLRKVESSKQKIARLGCPFIHDEAVILTHSRSRVVLQLLKEARAKKRFKVYVTESLPDRAGLQMAEDLCKLGIEAVTILDCAMGYIMEKVSMVVVGAEGVLESGGIVNKIGTYTMAIAAKEKNRPFYVVAESFKFARLFPLNQQDVPHDFKYPKSVGSDVDIERTPPLVDYTPPEYITLLFTDIGVLTPSAVSDELIKLS